LEFTAEYYPAVLHGSLAVVPVRAVKLAT
jgi:hypothetical protein